MARGHPDLLRQQRSRERARDRTARRRRPLRPARHCVHAVAAARGWLCRALAVGDPRARPDVPARGVWGLEEEGVVDEVAAGARV